MLLLLSLLSAGAPAWSAPLTEAEAVAAGLPAAGRTWASTDYEAYAGAVEALPYDRLPTAGSALFAREIAQDNLVVEGPPAYAMGEVLKIGPAHTRVLQHYLNGLVGGAKLLPEVLYLSGFMLRWTVREWEALDAFLATQPPNFLDDPTRKAGFDQVKSGTATILAGTLTSLEDPTVRDEPALAAYATELAATWPALTRRLGELERTEAQKRLDRLVASLPACPLKQALAPVATKPAR